jgi:hypothetical protein
VQALTDVATAIGEQKGEKAPLQGHATDAAKAIAASLLSGERKAILLGNAAAHHPTASSLLSLANWIGRDDRRQRGLPHRGRQHRGRAAGERDAGAGRPERRADAVRRPQGAVPAEHRTRVRRRRRRPGRWASKAAWSSR